ncbi:MAG: hypothetical protein WBA39_05280 [Rivularia sp. (in: cyanobacteria)]
MPFLRLIEHVKYLKATGENDHSCIFSQQYLQESSGIEERILVITVPIQD